MTKTVFAVGANSVVARAVLPLLRDCTIVSGGRNGCDVYCDLTKRVTVPDGIDVVLNFAANFGGTDDADLIDAVQTNVLGLLRLCGAANTANAAHIIQLSSVFALLADNDPQFSMYSLTKRQGDELARFYCEGRPLGLTILRPSRLYGDTAEFAKGQPFLYRSIEQASRGEDISVYGAHDAERNYLHCADLAEVISRVIERQLKGTYSCVHPSDISCRGVAELARDVFGGKSKVHFLEDRPDIPSDSYPRETVIYEKVDYWPTLTLEVGMRRIKESMQRKV